MAKRCTLVVATCRHMYIYTLIYDYIYCHFQIPGSVNYHASHGFIGTLMLQMPPEYYFSNALQTQTLELYAHFGFQEG